MHQGQRRWVSYAIFALIFFMITKFASSAGWWIPFASVAAIIATVIWADSGPPKPLTPAEILRLQIRNRIIADALDGNTEWVGGLDEGLRKVAEDELLDDRVGKLK